MTDRPLKFRIWDKVDKNWTFFTLNNSDLIGMNMIFNYPARRIYQQFTGLLDKDGKEIYEGDIIELFGSKEDADFVVEWDDTNARFELNSLEGGGDWFAPKDRKIVGNIFETPHLLDD